VRQVDPETLRKAFLWREKRQVRKDGRISLQGNTYRVDPQFIGRQIELRFDPFDLSALEVWLDGQPLGKASVLQQGREQHIAVEHLTTPPTSKPAQPKSSLDYLAVLRAEYHQHQRQQAGSLRFSQLPTEKA
jgi:putative transposase